MTTSNVFGETLLSKAVDTRNMEMFVTVKDALLLQASYLDDVSQPEVSRRKHGSNVDVATSN